MAVILAASSTFYLLTLRSLFAIVPSDFVRARGNGRDHGPALVEGNWPDVKIKQSEHTAVKSCANTPPQTPSLQDLQNKHLAIST